MSSLEPYERGDLPPASFDTSGLPRAVVVPEPPRDRIWLHVLLFFATLATTTLVGAGVYGTYATDFGQRPLTLTRLQLLVHGLWYSLPALTILGAHEMGHYLACRYYGIDASLPYFIPTHPVFLFGTFGAVIRIREPIRTKRQLFDIGVAGPIAGFVLAVPALLIGFSWSRVVRLPRHLPGGVDLGEPILFQLAERFFFGTMPKGFDICMHPLVFAAWFGLLATALNLVPIGQLDGGHIAYANLGRRANIVTYVTLSIMFVLGIVVAPSWLFWSTMMLGLLWLFGWQHPPTSDEHESLGTTRLLITLFAILMFVLCFTPMPVSPSDLVSR